ncbi:MAG: DUF6458 family protein [Pseudomonadota bacterium]
MRTPFGLGLGLVLIAVGAVLVWGVTADAEGIDVDAVGVILMIVGLVAALVSLFTWDRWRGGTGYARRERVVERAAPPVAERREVIVEEDVAPAPGPPGTPPP